MRVLDRLSEDDRLAIVERYAAGEGAAVVGKQYGISRNSVMGLVDAAGVPRKQRRMTDREVSEAARLYKQGRSLARVGRQLGFDHTTIWKVLKRDGVPMRYSHGR
jgi:transposase-like protein